MSHITSKNKRIIQNAMEILPKFVSNYPETEQEHLKKFLEALKVFNIDTQSQRVEILRLYQEYINDVLYSSDYFNLPFLWFSCSFIQNLIRFGSLISFHGEDYYKHFSRVILGVENISLIHLIREKIPLTDKKWEELQYFCLRLVPILSEEEIDILKELKNIYRSRDIVQFCPKDLQTLFEKKLNQSGLTKKLDRLFTRLGAEYSIYWNFSAFGLEYYHFVFERSKLSSLLELFYLVNSSRSKINKDIFQLQWLYNDQELFRCYAWIVIPQFYISDFNVLFEHMAQQGLFVIRSREILLEYGSWISQLDYSHNKPITIPPLNSLIAQIRKIEKKVPPEDSPVMFINHQKSDNWHYRRQRDPLKYIDFFCTPPPSIGLNPFNTSKKCYYEDEKLQVAQELAENKVIAPVIRFPLLEQVLGMEHYYIQCPKSDFAYLPHLLQFFPSGSYGLSKEWVYLQVHSPLPLINQLVAEVRPFNWLIRPIQDAYNPPLHNREWFDYDSLQWKKPGILKSYLGT